MANNKVQLADGTTLIDLTSDTVTPQTMLAGATAHAASGEQITGVVNLANAGDAVPLADNGSGAVGSSTDYAREDHVHPLSNDYIKNAGGYNGATDIDTVVDYAVNTGIINHPFYFNVNYETGKTQGYFGTSSFLVICRISSSNYGYGIIISDNNKSIATFVIIDGTRKLFILPKKLWTNGVSEYSDDLSTNNGVSITPGTNVSIEQDQVYIRNNVLYFYIRFKLTAAVSQYSHLIYFALNGKTFATGLNKSLFNGSFAPSSYSIYADAGGTTLRTPVGNLPTNQRLVCEGSILLS